MKDRIFIKDNKVIGTVRFDGVTFNAASISFSYDQYVDVNVDSTAMNYEWDGSKVVTITEAIIMQRMNDGSLPT